MAVWVSTHGSNIPDEALRAGYEADGKPLFIAKAIMEASMTPGKCGFHLDGAHIPYDSKEQVVDHYEVLVFPFRKSGFLNWQKASNGYVPPNACKTDDGIYVGRAFHEGSLVPGKVHVDHHCAYISYGGKEFSYKDYEVLYEVK
ncbi:natterin-3-like [Saccostrea echinata]|uniref:natterin-3-like n=1 Tax=Saccostrea echinata TaxID=191078 RepID=UPI002A83D28F|nr:natterin-3-like [Saccostrea echinata]